MTSFCLQDLLKSFRTCPGRTIPGPTQFTHYSYLINLMCRFSVSVTWRTWRKTHRHQENMETQKVPELRTQNLVCSEVTVLTAASHACWPGVLYKSVMDGGWPWEKLSLCLSAVGCSGQWVSRAWGPHKYCVWFHFLYALPWAQLSISGQFCCPQGELAGSADPVHMLSICFGLSFIHPLKTRTGQRCSWWTRTTAKLENEKPNSLIL